MKKHSCGALLFTLYNNKIYIVLGMEKNEWFPFKGTKEIGESLNETAIREIYEETCGIVELDNIYLSCNYSTKRKYYHIGLVFVNINILKKFYKKRNMYKFSISNNYEFLEKTGIKLFNINKLGNHEFHNVSLIPINYYKNFLLKLQNIINNSLEYKDFISNNIFFKKTQPTDIQKSPNINMLLNDIYKDKKLINMSELIL
jgi:hypothetical protein